MSGRRARGRAIPAIVLSSSLFVPTSASADDDCVVSTAAFPPGVWAAQGGSFLQDISDGISTGFLEGNFGFTLTVENSGVAYGDFVMVLNGTLEDTIDLSSANAVIVQSGPITGTGALAEVHGSSDFDIDANIDVAGRDGRDLFSGGHLLFENHADFSRPYTTIIEPSFVNCGEAIGNLSSDPSTPIVFIATRIGAAPDTDADIGGMTVDFLEGISALHDGDGFDPDGFGQLVNQGEAIDALIAAQEYCATQDLGSLAPGGSTRDLFRSTLAETLYTFASRAAAGEFTVAEIISVYATAIRGSMFGGPAGSCVAEGDPAREGLKSAFEQALIDRYDQALSTHDSAEQTMIRVAAAQYEMTDVLQAIGF